MAFADSVGGYFAYKTVKKSIVTVNLNSNFIRPAPVGCWLEAHGKVKKHGTRDPGRQRPVKQPQS